MWELVVAGGWVMAPILFCSALALAIAIERVWALRASAVTPPVLVRGVAAYARGEIGINELEGQLGASPLGRIVGAGLAARNQARALVRERIEEAGRAVVHDLERYLNTLGTIAAVSPLLGLLGTVFGMIQIFAAITAAGVGDAQALAGGISQALITTAAGLCVAIPALIVYRSLRGRVDDLVVRMEAQAVGLLEGLGRHRPAERQ